MLIRADARQIPLIDGCVQTVVTSPPYWGLRDYGNGGQIGLEKTPEAFVASLVAVFAEVWRVLKDDGTVWLNLGDSYSGGKTGRADGGRSSETFTGNPYHGEVSPSQRAVPLGYKAKDLVGIPWRVAFALQAAGWYLRADIIWSKPNPMPESVTDRPTKAHEYIFLLSKQERYYYDAAAVSEVAIRAGDQNNATEQHSEYAMSRVITVGERRNKRSVWHIATQPYAGSHFATFPEALIEPCILAGSRPGDLVFDPFVGSGTVGAVAERFGRRWVGTDLGYQHLAKKRTQQRGLRLGA